jgi:hypothetical protein
VYQRSASRFRIGGLENPIARNQPASQPPGDSNRKLQGTLERRKQKGRPQAASCSESRYLQQLPPPQQAGSPQQALTVAAEADRDNSMTAANAIDRTLIFIKISFRFSIQE